MITYSPPEPEAEQESTSFGLPHSREAEEGVIGSVLINPSVYDDLCQFVHADDFYIHRLRFIWDAFKRLSDRQTPIDFLTINQELDDMGRLDEIGGPAYITSLLNQVPTSLNAEYYGNIIYAKSIRRKLLIAGNEIASLAYDDEIEIADVVSRSEQAVSKVSGNISRKEDVSAHDAIRELCDHVYSMADKDCPPGILTGSQDYDSLTGGLIPGTSGLIGARPGVGKTALLLTWVVNIQSRKNAPYILYNCMEMTPRRLMGRMAAILSGVSAEKIRNGTLCDEDWPVFNHAIEVISSWPLMIIDERDPFALLSRVKIANRRGECDILMNDYVGKFEAKADSRVHQVGIASSILSKIAVKVNIPVMAAAQVSRTIDTRGKDSELVLSDLKESGDLEQDADTVLFLNQDTAVPNLRKCRLAKNRDGKVGLFDLLYKSEITKFENVVHCKVDPSQYRDISGERD